MSLSELIRHGICDSLGDRRTLTRKEAEAALRNNTGGDEQTRRLMRAENFELYLRVCEPDALPTSGVRLWRFHYTRPTDDGRAKNMAQ